MDIFTLVAGGILGLLLLYVIMRMSYVIMRNVTVSMEFRKNLASTVHTLRLNNMLGALGIDVNRYLHNERILDIEEHIDKCTSCQNTDTCDEQLAQGSITASNIDYCNNAQALQQIVTSKAAHES
jgi:hypothetical protein